MSRTATNFRRVDNYLSFAPVADDVLPSVQTQRLSRWPGHCDRPGRGRTRIWPQVPSGPTVSVCAGPSLDVRSIEWVRGGGRKEVSEHGERAGTSSARGPEASPQALSRHALSSSGRELGTPAVHPRARAQPPRTGACPYPAPGRGEGASAGGTRPRPRASRRVARVSRSHLREGDGFPSVKRPPHISCGREPKHSVSGGQCCSVRTRELLGLGGATSRDS